MKGLLRGIINLAEAVIYQNTAAESLGIPLNGEPALLHFCRSIDVVVWAPKKVGIFEENRKKSPS